MTPAIALLKKAGVEHRLLAFDHHQSAPSYGLEAATLLDLPVQRVFKTLVVRLGNGELAVAIIPVSALLSLKQMARATGAKKVEMAPPAAVERSTGYLLGGVSPLAQKKPLQTVIDNAARDHLSIFVSAGRRGLEVELKPEDLKLLTDASYAELCQLA